MRHLRTTLQALVMFEAVKFSLLHPSSDSNMAQLSNNDTQLITILSQSHGRGMADHDVQPKSKPWLGYYDFLITEGSYKFWVVFELFTVALLVYSAFAALYYAKYTTPDYDYDDYFFKKRSSRSARLPSPQTTFLGLSPQTYFRIFESITELSKKYNT